MGQYYKPISIDKKQYVYSHNYDNGLKLMEHSWIDNKFVAVVEDLIAEGGAWHGDRIVWAGDYADEEKNRKSNLFSLTEADKCRIHPPLSENKYRYVLNMDTKEFVDKDKVPVTDVWDGFEFRIHPLPLLTCEGNGRGGGDYHQGHPLVGTWARNRVAVSNTVPEGFTEVVFDLVENSN